MRLRTFGIALFFPFASFALVDAPYTFTNIDVPGAAQTVATGINTAGRICGFYTLAPVGSYHAFVRDTSGVITTFDYPGSAMTAALGINDLGQIVGYWSPDLTGNIQHTFLRDAAGNLTSFNVQRTPSNAAFGINDSGQTVANALAQPGPIIPVFLQPSGSYTVIAVPGASGVSVYGLNNAGTSVGGAYGVGGNQQAFIVTNEGGGTVTTFSVPGSTTTTVARGINDTDVTVGYYTLGYCGGESSHGYIRDADGVFQALDLPGATSTSAYGIDDLDRIVGTYDDSLGGEHGFLAVREVRPRISRGLIH